MNYGYIRVSTDKQTTANQKFEIKNFAKQRSIFIQEWIEETISATKKLEERKFGHLCKKANVGSNRTVTPWAQPHANHENSSRLYGEGH